MSQPSAAAPGTPTCGPFGEGTTYITASGQQINGTRGPFGSAFGNDDFEASIGNSTYNSFQTTVQHSGKKLNVLVGYTFSKSLDNASSLADPVDPLQSERDARAFSL